MTHPLCYSCPHLSDVKLFFWAVDRTTTLCVSLHVGLCSSWAVPDSPSGTEGLRSDVILNVFRKQVWLKLIRSLDSLSLLYFIPLPYALCWSPPLCLWCTLYRDDAYQSKGEGTMTHLRFVSVDCACCRHWDSSKGHEVSELGGAASILGYGGYAGYLLIPATKDGSVRWMLWFLLCIPT